MIAPLVLLSIEKIRKSAAGLFTAACLVIFGVVLNRINVFLVAYNPLYADKAYFPSIYEFALTIGLVALLVLVYRAIVMIFPVISHRHEKESPYPGHVQENLIRTRS